MDIAECRIKGNPERKIISAKDDILTGKYAEDDIIELRCFYCKELAQLVHDPKRILHFRAEHPDNCPCVNDGREHKIYKITDDTIADDVENIVNFQDNAPREPFVPPLGGDGPEKGNGIIPPNDIDDIDRVIQHGVRYIHTVRGLYNLIRERGPDADLGNGKTGRDLLLDDRALLDVRWNKDLRGIRIAIATRVNPKTLSHEINIPLGYVLFKDRFSENEPDTVYFLVKLRHEEQNKEFRNKVMGTKDDPTIRDPHKDILLLAKWTKIPNDYYLVVSGEINSRCYSFFNYKE